MVQASVAVVERKAAVKSLVDPYLGPGEAETACLLGDLKAAPLPLHHIVVANDPFVHEAADPFEIFWNRAPGGLLFARVMGETAVVIGDELAQHGVGRVDVICFSQPQLACETILKYTPETLDAAFRLWAASGNESNAELFQGATELGGLTFSGELFFDGPVVVVTNEDTATIAVKGQG